MLNNQERGVSLIITFFVMTILLAVVLGVSVILYSGIKIIRNIGDSVVSYYLAESGMEKTLYYDRSGRPAYALRGLCNMCNDSNADRCPNDDCKNCIATDLSEDGCDPEKCFNCELTYETSFNGGGKKYKIKATVVQEEDKSNITIDAFGFYEGVSRAIELKNMVEGTVGLAGPSIKNASAVPISVELGYGILITADIYDNDGVDVSSIIATIRSSTGETFTTNANDFVLTNELNNTYTATWVGPHAGFYYVDITACDNSDEKNCTTINNI